MKLILEHIDPEFYEWSLAEYENIVKIIGKENILFTNISDFNKLNFAECEKKFVKEIQAENPSLRFCVLDPESDKELISSDKEKFDYFVIGGILGNNPPDKKTEKLLSSQINCETRNLGKKQMSTDTASIVVWKILNGMNISDIKFVDDPEIEIEDNLTTIMPYRYLDDGTGKPIISQKVMELIKKGW